MTPAEWVASERGQAVVEAMTQATRGHYRVIGYSGLWDCKCGDDRPIEQFENHLNDRRLAAALTVPGTVPGVPAIIDAVMEPAALWNEVAGQPVRLDHALAACAQEHGHATLYRLRRPEETP